MSKDEIQKSDPSGAPVRLSSEVAGLSKGILAADDDLTTHKQRLREAREKHFVAPIPEEDPGFLESIFLLAFSPVLLPLGAGVLFYEKIYQPIADHIKTAKRLKRESKEKLAELAGKQQSILVDGKIHPNDRKATNKKSYASEFRNMKLENDLHARQSRREMLDQAQTLVERATRSLKSSVDPKALTDKKQ